MPDSLLALDPRNISAESRSDMIDLALKVVFFLIERHFVPSNGRLQSSVLVEAAVESGETLRFGGTDEDRGHREQLQWPRESHDDPESRARTEHHTYIDSA